MTKFCPECGYAIDLCICDYDWEDLDKDENEED